MSFLLQHMSQPASHETIIYVFIFSTLPVASSYVVFYKKTHGLEPCVLLTKAYFTFFENLIAASRKNNTAEAARTAILSIGLPIVPL